MTTSNHISSVTRRSFLAGTGAGALSFTILKPSAISAYAANEKIRLGMVGCGGRGNWIGNLFMQNGKYEITACADYFKDYTTRFGDRFQVPQEMQFNGLKGYQRMLDRQSVDAIAIESPPYFHPEQTAAGIEAGVHVYCAKPIAVDVPGCRTLSECGRHATEKNLCLLIDFQTRANALYQEALKRVRDGALGDFAFGEAYYHAEVPWERQYEYLRDDPGNPENRLRAWGLDRVLSGDIITEQNIHTLDVASWIMDSEPLQASGRCSQKVRPYGDCNDNFTVVYDYPDNVGLSFTSRQFEGYGSHGGINNRMYGSDGVLETSYGGEVLIRGKHAFPGGNTGNIFTDGVIENIQQFHTNIIEGKFDNPTVEPSVRSNLLTILGRTAAYKNEIVTWNQLLKDNEKLEADLKGLKI
ncbi:MAG: Gfo/Idh/MocA family protein [bacterium]